jgi:hypothetical protein
MISTWRRWGDHTLARFERAGFPPLAVTAVAYLIGFEIAYFLDHRRGAK